jgi:hypothetical protein
MIVFLGSEVKGSEMPEGSVTSFHGQKSKANKAWNNWRRVTGHLAGDE